MESACSKVVTMVDCTCAFRGKFKDIIAMRKCTEWKASRWMCLCLLDIVVQYFISQLLRRVKLKVVGVNV